MKKNLLTEQEITTNPPTWQHPVLPGNGKKGAFLRLKLDIVESPQTTDVFEWWDPIDEGGESTSEVKSVNDKRPDLVGNVSLEASDIPTDTNNVSVQDKLDSVDDTISDMQIAIGDKSKVSGTSDGTNWASITIDGTTRNIPSGEGGFTPTQAQLDAMNSGIDSTKVGQIDTNADDIDNINDTIADIQSDLADKVDKVAGKGLSTNDYTDADKAKVAEIDNKSVVSGTNDGTNWTSLTINGTTKNIPSGGGGGGFTPTQPQLDAMNSGIDTTKVAQIQTNANDIANKVDKVTGKGLSTNDYTAADKAKVDKLTGSVETLVFTLANDTTVTLTIPTATSA